MKTLLFAPLYLGEDRLERNKKWISYYTSLINDLYFNEIVLVDNGSSMGTLKEFEAYIKSLNASIPITILKCDIHIPRLSLREYEYWYRAFRIALVYAMKNNYNKFLHIDSDVFLLSRKLVDFVNSTHTGWNSFWSSKYGFAESTFQIIGEDQFLNALQFFTLDYIKNYGKDDAENIIPWTNNIKQFNGDRFGEMHLEQTLDMDYYAQCPNHIYLRYQK